MIRLALWVFVIDMLASACGGECQAVCNDFVVTNATVDAPVASLQGSSLVFCQNSRCTMPTQVANNAMISGGGICATVALGDELTTTTVSISLDLSGRSCTVPPLSDGDSFRITITDTDGQVVTDQSGVTNYNHQSLCGTECQSVILQLMPD